jgi:hypothetical protein
MKLRTWRHLKGRIEAGLAQALRVDFLAGSSQRLGLGLAPPFRESLGEIGEQHGDPEPQAYAENECRRRLALSDQGMDQQNRGEEAAHVDDEHDRVVDLHARIKFAEGIDKGMAQEARIRRRRTLLLTRLIHGDTL